MQFTILHLPELSSTHVYACEHITKEKFSEFTVVITDKQIAGRGMNTNSWESEPFMNLTFSVVLSPVFLPAAAQFVLNKTLALTVHDVVAALVKETVWIKWPNDIYINQKKVAGMLIHNAVQGETLSATVASIGLNVNQEVFKSNAPNPVSLKQITGVQYDLQLLLNTLMQRLMQRYEQLKTGKWDSLDSDYLRCLFRFRELAQYIYKNKRISARITGIDEFGRLMLEDTKQQAYLCEMKEIRFCL